MTPKFRAWSKVNVGDPEMRVVEGINYHGDGVWFNKMYDDETVPDWGYFSDIILMQSTGLFDKNGVEIFEGDVIAYQCTMETHGTDEVEKAYVEFVNTVPYAVNPQYERSRDNILLDGSDWEVIGSIYENPDLVN